MRIVPLMVLAMTGCAADIAFNCVGDAPMCDLYEVTGDERSLASGLDITRVMITQGVHGDLVLDGEAVEPDVPIVAGREAMVRVFVEPNEDWQVRDVTARILLWRDGEVVGAAQAEARPSGPSTIETMNSTINVLIPGNMMAPGEVEWSVELLENPLAERAPGSTRGAEFPQGTAFRPSLEIQDGGVSMRVYLVPVRWMADGSGRVPDTTELSLQIYRDKLYSIFPAAEIEFEVGEPFDWEVNSTITSQTLQAITELRGPRNVAEDQYIYGMLNPPEGIASPAAGLSWVGGSPLNSSNRASIGLTRGPGGGAATMAHEIGHASGRSHAPCGGAAGPDPGYPHDGAFIGAWGYDLVADILYDPSTYYDLMSYCGPEWVSDYHYDLMFQKQRGIYEEVLGGPDGITDRRRTEGYRMIWLHSDGQVARGDVAFLAEPPAGESRQVAYDGQDADGVFVPFDHVDGGVLYVPTEDDVESVRIDGGPELMVEELVLRR